MKLNKKLLIVLIIASLLPPLVFRIMEYRNGKFDTMGQFIESLLYNSLISLVVTLVIAFVILSILHWLNKNVPWTKNILKRLFIEIIATFPVALALGYLFGVLTFKINPYTNQNYDEFVFSFLLISAIMNFILVAVSDWFYFFNRWKESLIENEKTTTANAILERENIRSQYEVLKNQVNPHFLFNSLNVLSSIIHSDPDKAEEFVDEFAGLYRYILDQNEKDLVTLKEELDICRSYIFLQDIRFNAGVECEFETGTLDPNAYMIFPLAVQTLLENAFKHNRIDTDSPLQISVSISDKNVIVINNLQPRIESPRSTGIGIPNLIQRYKHYNKVPIFEKTANRFRCVLPLITKQDIEEKI